MATSNKKPACPEAQSAHGDAGSDGLVQIGLQAGSTAQLNMGPLLVKRLTITGSTLRARSVQEKGAVAAAVRTNVWPLLESGAVKPIIHATFPLRAAADAHRLLESSQHIGKIVLVTS